jgi:hypothetical protein
MPPYDEWDVVYTPEHKREAYVWISSEKTMDAYDMGKGEDIKYKVGDLVRRKSLISSGVIGIVVERMGRRAGRGGYSHGDKYLISLQSDGSQVWVYEDQLEKVE